MEMCNSTIREMSSAKNNVKNTIEKPSYSRVWSDSFFENDQVHSLRNLRSNMHENKVKLFPQLAHRRYSYLARN